VPVETVDLPALDLGDPPPALDLQRSRGALELGEVGHEILVAGEPEVLAAQLVEGGSERAHTETISNTRSSPL